MNFRKCFLLICFWMLLVNAHGADMPDMVSISGTIKGGTEVRVIIIKSKGKQVEKLLTYYCSNENPDFGCWFPFEDSSNYSISFQVYKQSGNRVRFEKVAQFPLSLKRGGRYDLAVDVEKLDHQKKTGLTVMPAKPNKGVFLLSGVVNGVDTMEEFSLSKIVNGESVLLCNYGGSTKRNAFFFAMPKVQEGFITISGNNWKVRCYAKANDSISLSINSKAGNITSAKGSPENELLLGWDNLLAPFAVDDYRRVGLKNDTISMSNYLGAYNQQVEIVPAFVQNHAKTIAVCSEKFKQLFPLLQNADLELMPLWFYQTLLSRREGRIKGFEIKIFPESPAAFKHFASSNLFRNENVLELPEIARLLRLHSMLLVADSASRTNSALQFSDQMAITMAAIESERVKSFYLMKQLEELEVFNYTEFKETFAPFSDLVNSPKMKAKYDEVESEFIGDTAYIGKLASDFMLPDATGKMISMQELAGKVVFIDVWASWCGPCKDQIPYLKEIANEYASNDLVKFVGISIDKQADSAKWQRVIQSESLPGIQLLDDGGKQFGKKYRISAIPRFLLIDKSGRWKEVRCPRPSQKELLKKYLDAAIRA